MQAGQGLNPLTWLQLGEDMETPVADGRLAVWDTQGLNGLYTLQLLVVGEDQQVETTTIQVTVDNEPPEVSIRFPAPGQRYNNPPGASGLTLQADASDDLELARVEFFIDGELVAARESPPFAVPWEGTLGAHRLRVRATDRAGNTSLAEITFFVER
jgi:hypothetical protein